VSQAPPGWPHLIAGRPIGKPAVAQTADPAAAPAVFDATAIGAPLTLDNGWRVGITASEAPARPDFDDSRWAVRAGHGVVEDVPDLDIPEKDQPPHSGSPGQSGPPPPPPGGTPGPNGRGRTYAWFRLHVKLAPNHGPVALLIELPVEPNTSLGMSGSEVHVEVFANGKRMSPEGSHGDTPQHYQQISRIYNLDIPQGETSLVLVLRTPYYAFGRMAYTNFFEERVLRLGSHEELFRAWWIWADANLFENLPRLVISVLLAVLAFFLFALYYAQRDHIEYLWLGLHQLAQAPIAFIKFAGSSARIDSLWYGAAVLELTAISAYLFFEFLVAFLALRSTKWYVRWSVRLLRYTAPILACVGPSLMMFVRSHTVRELQTFILAGSALWILGWLIFVVTALIVATIRRNYEAGMLLLPLMLTGIGVIEPVFTDMMSDWVGHPYNSPLTIHAAVIPIHFDSIADFTGILVIILIIFGRFLRIQRDQERASSELAAARSVQELMIPHEKLKTPGFEVDSVYDPANEVGGDFFHLQATPDGGLLAVIGDVAGKGLKAAMCVSMLVGALRRTTERSPAKILSSLNRVLAGSDSFTTCQAAFFAANGEVVLANAGHLPPYLNSQEVDLPGDLPLGVLPEIAYAEVHVYLHPGDRLLLLSDGVVEARQASGELFGFDRVHNLCNQSAFYVAEAAKSFGQEDDITVLTVKRIAQAKAA
jgi:hypothetical protein